MVLALRDYVNKNRFPGVVLGLSGGIDSAISAAVKTAATEVAVVAAAESTEQRGEEILGLGRMRYRQQAQARRDDQKSSA